MFPEISEKIERWVARLICARKGHVMSGLEIVPSWNLPKGAHQPPWPKSARVFACSRCGHREILNIRDAVVVDAFRDGESGDLLL